MYLIVLSTPPPAEKKKKKKDKRGAVMFMSRQQSWGRVLWPDVGKLASRQRRGGCSRMCASRMWGHHHSGADEKKKHPAHTDSRRSLCEQSMGRQIGRVWMAQTSVWQRKEAASSRFSYLCSQSLEATACFHHPLRWEGLWRQEQGGKVRGQVWSPKKTDIPLAYVTN